MHVVNRLLSAPRTLEQPECGVPGPPRERERTKSHDVVFEIDESQPGLELCSEADLAITPLLWCDDNEVDAGHERALSTRFGIMLLH